MTTRHHRQFASNTFRRVMAVVTLVMFSSSALETWAEDLPGTPILELVLARPFSLPDGNTHYWRAERPIYDAGYLLVIRAEPVVPPVQQIEQPVLYVGQETAERLNTGLGSNTLVVVVPGLSLGDIADVAENIDLSTARVFFGPPDFPGRLTAADVADVYRRAIDADLPPFPAEMIETARAAGGEPLIDATVDDLYREAGLLVRTYSPGEVDLINRLVRED